MARRRKCKICGNWIAEEDYSSSVPYKNGYAHETCLFKQVKEVAKETLDGKPNKDTIKPEKGNKRTSNKKPKAELKDPVSEEDYLKKKSFYEYVHKITQLDKLPAKVYVLAERYIEQYNFTFESMHQTLIYLVEILEKEVTGDGMGLIPYYHDDAIRYYENIKEIEQKNKDADLNNMYKKKTVKVRHNRPKTYKKVSFGDEEE